MQDTFLKQTIQIALPLALQSMLQSSFSMIDQIMVGQLGKVSVAAVEIGSKPGFVFAFVSGAVATVTGIMVSQYMGKKDDEKVKSSISLNLFVVLLIALFSLFLSFCASKKLALMFSEDLLVCDQAGKYMKTVAFTFPLSGSATILAVVIRCKNHSEYPLYVSFASALVNTALNYLLIFGHFAFPSLGIQGAAIASLASQFVNLLFMILFFARLSSFSFKIILTRADLQQYLAMLLPIVFNEFLWTLGQNINTGIYGHLGTDELAAMSLTGPVQGLLMGALSGLSQAAGILIGKGLGEKEYDRSYAESKKLCLYGLVLSFLLSFLCILFASFYTNLYNVQKEVKVLGTYLLYAFALLAPVKVLNMILGGGIVRSGGKTKYIMVIDMMGTWLIGLPLGLLSAFVFKLSLVWVYFILSQEELFRLLVTIFIFKKKKWMNTLS